MSATQLQSKPMSRRGFLKVAGAGCAVCAAAGLGGYGYDSRDLPPPLPESAALAAAASTAHPTPLLLLLGSGPQAAFGPFLGEILRAEGIPGFTSAAAAQLSPDLLRDRQVLLLGPGEISPAAARLLRDFVAGGGGLVAIEPPGELADLLGLQFGGGTITPGAVRTYVEHPFAAGIDSGALQIHVPLHQFSSNGAETIAVAAEGGAPAVTINRYGRGIALAWAFDLGRSIALARQGNPAWANQERDDLDGIRSADMFVGRVDPERMHIPYADELGRLLLNTLIAACPIPLPRLWYFPSATAATLVLTGDAHGSFTPAIDTTLAIVERHKAAMSVYYTPPPLDTVRRWVRRARWQIADLPVVGAAFSGGDGPPAPRDVARWRERGHEFGMHPYVEQGLESGYQRHWSDFVKLGYGPVAPTVRTHRILWRGWVDNPQVQARYGIGMNLDHYHVGSAVQRPDGSYVSGFLTGSGLPMRFVDAQGRLLRVYQQHTHLVDEQLMDVWADGRSANLSGDAAAAISEQLLADALARYPAALGVQCHLDNFTFGGERAANATRWMQGLLGAAAAAGVPLISAERWLHFSEQRAATTCDRVQWQPASDVLRFRLTNAASGDELWLMVPAQHAARSLRVVTINGAEQSLHYRQLGMARYAMVRVPAGEREILAQYATA
ncbi:MAG: twin-arginine translocation signal domain-containing protein [Oscillochloris sp.]|nr:twin-arginine translocation signal domain-containing protein [Oscillochloris sp.]